MRSDESSATGNQDTLALRGRQEFHGWETGEGSVGDGLAVWVEDGLGLVRCKTLGELCMQLFFLCILVGEIGRAWGGQDIMRAKIERSEEINGDFAVEAKTVETNGLDFLTRLVQDLNLRRPKRVRKEKIASGVKNGESRALSWDQRTPNAVVPHRW